MLKPVNLCSLVANALCYCVIIIACLCIMGWVLNIPVLYSFSSSFHPMHLLTAIFMILSSSALLLILTHQSKKLIIGIAWIVLLSAFSTIIDAMRNVEYGVPFLASLNLILFSLLLLFFHTRWSYTYFYSIIISIILLSSLFSILGYVFIHDDHFYIVSLTRMSLHSSISFFLLCTALILSTPDRGIAKRLLANTIDASILRRVPIFLFIVTIALALISNMGQQLNWYDDGFSDLLTAMGSIIVLIALLILTSNSLRKQESRGDMNEALLLGFSENVDDVFWQTTQDMQKIIYISPMYEKMWDRSRDELIKNPLAWMDSIILDDQARVKNKLEEFIRSDDDSISLEYRIQLADESLKYIYDRRFLQKDKNGNIISILGISTDISRIHLANQRMLIQYEVAKLISSGGESKQVMRNILKIICEISDWNIGEILLFNESDQILECLNSWQEGSISTDLVDQMKNIKFKPGFGVIGKAWKENKIIWRNDSLQIIRVLSSDENETTIRTIVASPISYQNSLIGVITFMSKNIKYQDESTMQLLEFLGIQLGEYISYQKIETKITQLSDIDNLTGLVNRNIFESNLQSKIDQHRDEYICCIVLDFDQFKLINEEYDYDAGDTILKLIISRLEKFADKRSTSRLSGNKFGIINNEFNDINQITQYAYKILSDIKQPIPIKDKSIFVTGSMGISIYPNDGNDAKQLIKNANLAFSKAKESGGDNFQFYTNKLTSEPRNQLVLISELKNAIEKNELILSFQPKVNLKTGNIQGAESLIRWAHPDRGILSPSEFMPIAEKNNLIIPITEWIISETCKIINEHKVTIPLAVNLSAEHFKESFNLVGYISQILKGFHIRPDQIELEITETIFMDGAKNNLSVLMDLKSMGFKIAIDDFGTGFSSLNYLKNIAADYIKIDKSFIDNIPDNIDSVIITKAIIDLSHSLQKNVIAEGVENAEQLAFLVENHCDQIQGYYFSKPLSIQELMELINSGKRWEVCG